MRDAPEQICALLLRNAAPDSDNDLQPPLLQLLPPSQSAIDFLLCLVANAAGVKQDQIRARNAIGPFIIHAAHDLRDALGIVLIHLAAIGLKIELFHGVIRSTTL